MSYAYMKVLESAPYRYDRGMRILSHGHIAQVYARIADLVAAPGRRVLDIGCGTGGVALACASRGAEVVAVDRSPGMLEVARSKPGPTPPGRVEWLELDASEIGDRIGEGSLDAAVACLAFSEFSHDEQTYVLGVLRSRLRPGGVLVLADEVVPPTPLRRIAYRLRRIVLGTITYALTQAQTHPLADPAGLARQAGFTGITLEDRGFGSLVLLRAINGASS